ncbi:glycosyltransferase family 4 protein [Luteibacter sp. 3190]|uniref:glycosyltransferase family 4 protein n=1 Tax=Luteibacter sp. 3190 TaxID=2817736 RepID=UPI0028600CE6|nr:glycosyltransferase family 4 protein [Luteibacter sp. 3190]MDR6934879.1 phosphatidylinositol alpha-1,6-mannosyltransferase [Luteibacter sp. 3190]
MVTRNMPPLRGGMERLNAHMASELAERYEVDLVGPLGCSAFLGGSTRVHEAPTSNVALFLLWALFKSVTIALRRRPRVILGGSGLVAPIVRIAALVSGGRSALYLHGLDIVVGHSIYQRIWIPLIRRARLCICNSRATATLARQAGIHPDRLVVVNPGADTAQIPATGAFHRRHGIDGAKVLLSVGRITERKGLDLFIEHVLPRVVAKIPEARLVVIGDDAPDALTKGARGMRDRVERAIRKTGLEAHVVLLGPVSEAELTDAYASSDVHVFPVREVPGDIEGFGMVAIESATQGLPTVAFAVGGVTDAVSEGVSGRLIPAGDYAGFAEATISLVTDGRARLGDACREFAAGFSWDRFGVAVRDAIGGASKV